MVPAQHQPRAESRRDSAVLRAAYEALREAVMAGSPDGWRHGHGVLAGRGMAAWITAWTAPTPLGAGTTASPSHTPSRRLPPPSPNRPR